MAAFLGYVRRSHVDGDAAIVFQPWRNDARKGRNANVAAIRQAYMATMADPEFAEVLKKQSLDLDPIRGEDIAEIVSRLYAQPASVVERARDMLPPS